MNQVIEKLTMIRKDIQWISAICFTLSVSMYVFFLGLTMGPTGKPILIVPEAWTAAFSALIFALFLLTYSRGFARLGSIGIGLIIGSTGPFLLIPALAGKGFSIGGELFPDFGRQSQGVPSLINSNFERYLQTGQPLLVAGVSILTFALVAGTIRRMLSKRVSTPPEQVTQ